MALVDRCQEDKVRVNDTGQSISGSGPAGFIASNGELYPPGVTQQ
jgi:hypothetical protein